MCAVDIDFFHKFKEVVEQIGKTGNEYATAKSNSWKSQELKGSVLASIIKSLGDIPVSKAEIQARTHEDYIKHLNETAEAIRKELQLKASYEMWKSSFEALRSLSSLEKATRNLTGE